MDGIARSSSLNNGNGSRRSAGANGYKSVKRRDRMPRRYRTQHYTPLPKTRGSIRLLNLFSGGPENTQLDGELINFNSIAVRDDDPFDQDDHFRTFVRSETVAGVDETPHYEALSWCWGREDESKYIIIHKGQIAYRKYIKPNLFDALMALRHPEYHLYLWVDAICIDQDNLDEKNHQVELMSEIYGNAARVCIWLGPETESSRTALLFIKNEVLQLQNFDDLCDNKDNTKKWRALLELMQLPWFSRRWVVQEVSLARRAVLCCGPDQISWKKFAIAVELFVEVETATHRLSEVMKKDPTFFHVPGFFEYVSALGASLLVDATGRLFRDNTNPRSIVEPQENGDFHPVSMDSDSDSDSAYEVSIASEYEDEIPHTEIATASESTSADYWQAEYSWPTSSEPGIPGDKLIDLRGVRRT